MATSYNKHNAMIMTPRSRSCFLILFMLSVYALPTSSDDKGFQIILINFKNSLTNAHQLQNWTLSDDPLCINNSSNWTGVVCKVGIITGLRLENLSLGGKIDLELLSQLPLFSLSLSDNNFSGPFPSNLKKLGRLRRLLLSNNSFSGEIPDDAFDGMSALWQVELAYNMFSGEIPTSLTRVPLQILKLQNNQFEGRIPEFWPEGLQANFSNNALTGAIPDVFRNGDPSMFSGNPSLCGPPLAPCAKGRRRFYSSSGRRTIDSAVHVCPYVRVAFQFYL